MDVPELLRQALHRVPESARSDAGLSPGDIGEYLEHDEWEVALGILTDFGDQAWQTTRYWDLLAAAADQMRLDHQTAWCRWRRLESEHGLIRADLQLISPQHGGRRLPLPGPGILRPMWAITRPGSDKPAGLHIAAIWVESMPEIPPGGRASIRLAPLTPDDWKHLVPSDVITMHERQPVAGTATITQAQWPQPSR
jgi:hypothetical protein